MSKYIELFQERRRVARREVALYFALLMERDSDATIRLVNEASENEVSEFLRSVGHALVKIEGGEPDV